jgi:hypothetical protein
VGIGVDYVAENDVTHILGIDAGARNRFPHARCRHLAGRRIFEAATVPSDRRSNSAKNYNFSIHN